MTAAINIQALRLRVAQHAAGTVIPSDLVRVLSDLDARTATGAGATVRLAAELGLLDAGGDPVGSA